MSEYSTFISQINSKLDIDLTSYKEAQMKRRLTSLRNKRGYNSFSDYFAALSKDNELLSEFMDRITINVSEFYRNPKRWDVLRNRVFPLITKDTRSIKIWSAACSTGEEPYSLAIMLKEHFPNVNASIIATDFDEKILARAKEGIYNEQDLKDLPNHKITKYFTHKNDKYYINEELKKTITFKKHDLLKDRYPDGLDLLVCRNVLIYFTDDAKEMIYTKFGAALKKDSILFVGSTEQIFNPAKYNLSLYDTFYYQKQ